MGSQPWGGATIPTGLTNSFRAFAGLDGSDDLTDATTPVYSTYNLKEELERLWYTQQEHALNNSFDDDDGGGNLLGWQLTGVSAGQLADGVASYQWTWDSATGTITHASGALSTGVTQYEQWLLHPIEEGKHYRVQFTVSGRTTGGVQVRLGGVFGTGLSRETDGTFSEDIVADDGNYIAFVPTANFDGAITEIHVLSVIESPYGLVELHDPNTDVDAADARYATFDGDVTGLDPAADYASDAVAVAAAVAASVSWVSAVSTIVSTYESDKLPELQRGHARLLAQLADVGAIHSTASFKGMAILEGEYDRDSNRFRAEMLFKGYDGQMRAIVQGITDVQMARRFKVEAGRLSTLVKTELSKFNIIANNDYIKQELMAAVQAELWNVDLLDRVKSVNMISGAPVLNRGLEPWQAATSLALSTLGGAMNMLAPLAQAGVFG